MALVSSLPTILLAMLGVSATVAVAWINQRGHNRRELLREEIRSRETLYGEFIAECARLFIDAVQHTLEKPETLLPAYGLINRIRLCASQVVLAEAVRLVDRIAEQYFSANLTVPELRDIRRAVEVDPKLEDPEYLAEPVAIGDVAWTYRPDLKFAPAPCDPAIARLTVE
jgi:hypothetical protein